MDNFGILLVALLVGAALGAAVAWFVLRRTTDAAAGVEAERLRAEAQGARADAERARADVSNAELRVSQAEVRVQEARAEAERARAQKQDECLHGRINANAQKQARAIAVKPHAFRADEG